MGFKTGSVIFNQRVANMDRKFGAGDFYVPAMVELPGGAMVPALFTESAIDAAIQRANDNPEDAPTASWWRRLFG